MSVVKGPPGSHDPGYIFNDHSLVIQVPTMKGRQSALCRGDAAVR